MNRQNLNVVRSQYPNQSFDSFLSSNANQQLLVHSITAVNGSASANTLAICHSITEIETSFEVDGNDYLFQASDKYGMLAIDLTTDESGSPTFTYTYWNGSAFATLNLDYEPDLFSTGIKVIAFSPPLDWALDSDDMYSIKIEASGVITYAFTEVKFCNILALRENVLPNAELQVRFETRQLLLQQGEEIIGFFAFPSTSNTMEASYQINP